jgi:hypothetical protein
MLNILVDWFDKQFVSDARPQRHPGASVSNHDTTATSVKNVNDSANPDSQSQHSAGHVFPAQNTRDTSLVARIQAQ